MSNRKDKRNRFRNHQKMQHQLLNEPRQRAFTASTTTLDPQHTLCLPLDLGKNVPR